MIVLLPRGAIASEWHMFASDRRIADRWPDEETLGENTASPKDESRKTAMTSTRKAAEKTRFSFSETETDYAARLKNDGTGNAGVHSGHLEKLNFIEVESPEGFCPFWHSFRSTDDSLIGHYHVLASNDLWSIAIHDFTLSHDMFMEFRLPEYLSVAWYQSISGEQFTPYQKLRANSIWGFCSSDEGWRGFIHGGIPVQSVSVEVRPELSHEYLSREYGGQFERVCDAFASLNDMEDFPEMRKLLRTLWPQPGDENRSRIYYEGKVLETMGLIVERTKASKPTAPLRPIADGDRAHILSVTSYIDDHCSGILRIADLSRAACMSPTKFKECFKAVTGSTLTRYVQRRRISQSELLLRQSDLSIEQISRAVGYSCTSRFSELFRRETGLLPSEYRDGLR